MTKTKKLNNSNTPEVSIKPNGKSVQMNKELVISFKDEGNGYSSNIHSIGFSIFEQIGILESLKVDLITRNFKSEKA